ncbi:MAG: glycoside hydrolase family 2 TIM barrel-domain containing protein [Sphaerochaetaceae bacterium]|nr:glycoside hydrolase family 2 TIM barrel-domain containing protein [Sphaerochaetaceae bacterium]MDD4006736.1 glycoside hydrolase family 2 TIM barrel-domain containing protein [Sphaerochaetaceae bacterium]
MLYPRPQFQRDSCFLLDGEWHLETEHAAGSIIVPFSPETVLSGFPVQEEQIKHSVYTKEFSIPDSFNGKRIILNFIAVDQCCEVFINGHFAFSHEGGYLPFSGEISQFITADETVRIRVEVTDMLDSTGFGYGKQSLNPKGIWYHEQSGIWQSVWLEAVPFSFIQSVWINPGEDLSSVEITAFSELDEQLSIELDGSIIKAIANHPVKIQIANPHLWSPEDPYLYYFTMNLGDDTVRSYFGLRRFEVVSQRLHLNGKPYFHTGVLDQGYWKDSLYTPPSDQAMLDDILMVKQMGFNVIRKHIKVENPRWYYYCDLLGMLVWQDLPSGGTPYRKAVITIPAVIDFSLKDSHYSLFGRKEQTSRNNCINELREMITALHNCTCIAMWVPFNEGWGQFDSSQIEKIIRTIDSSRTIDNASGWHDQKAGQFRSLHVYFKPFEFKADKYSRAVILSEFGGLNCGIPGHSSNVNFGYSKQENQKALQDSITALYKDHIIPAAQSGLSGSIYTQLSDVETELNGLVTFDRKVVKIMPEAMNELNQMLRRALS